MAKNIYGPPMAKNTYSQSKKWQKTKFLENGDKTTTKVKPRSASVPLCSRLKNLQIICQKNSSKTLVKQFAKKYRNLKESQRTMLHQVTPRNTE